MNSFVLINALYQGKYAELLVENGKISALNIEKKHDYPHGLAKIDAKTQILLPSLIDCHVHLREPGFEWKEDIQSGLKAALYGGFGAVMPMANTKPVNDHAAVTIQMLSKAQQVSPVKLYPVAAATIGLKGTEMSPLYELQQAGCVAVSNDGLPVADTEIFRRIMEYASDLNMILIDHCEDPYLGHGVANEGRLSAKLGVKGSATVAESLQAARDVLLAEYLNIPVHIAHVSAKSTVDIIAYGKSKGVKVTAETCPHYLLLDENALDNYNCLAKVSPPLRTWEDVEALRKAVLDGTIDMLVTDHAPHAAHEKEVTLDQAPNGISGLDTALSLTYQLVSQGIISEKDLVRLWLEAPSKIFNLPANTFKVGDSADFILLDPKQEWLVNSQTMHSKSANTPYLNQKLQAKVLAHYINGVNYL